MKTEDKQPIIENKDVKMEESNMVEKLKAKMEEQEEDAQKEITQATEEKVIEVKEENIEDAKLDIKKDKSEEIEVDDKKVSAVKEVEAVINIYTSFNNTIAHVTDMSGKTISKVTGGMVTKHDRLKANPTIAMFIAKRISEDVKDLGVKSFYIRIRAKTGNPTTGPGAHAIVKSLTREGFRILNILDYTRVPRGGPKKKGGRRGRRP